MGQPGQAAAPLNIVRKRAGLPEVSGLSQEAMREKIIHERRMELAFEGHRWFDLRRTTRPEVIKNYMDADWNSLTVTIRQDDPKYIIPYPKEAIQNNPELNN